MPAFDRIGPAVPESPVILSVPHAGRDYPPEIAALLRAPAEALVALEDRFVDAVALAARAGEVTLIQRRARAWIDLNRDEQERDPRVDEGARRRGMGESAKVRSGLGLVPRRTGAAGDLWRRRLTSAEVSQRITDDHRPYHAALADAVAAARARFGTAVLLDLHSMPSLGRGEAQVVIGDRSGRSAAGRFVARAEGVARGRGFAVAINTPYAGGHILDRHGRPAGDVHALQLEVDRLCYLDAQARAPGPGLATVATLVREMIAALADEALSRPLAAAAE
jgi:N-formylglutamate amidohydrolase